MLKPVSHLTNESLLGKKTAYDSTYNPEHLFPIPRKEQRKELGLGEAIPFFGADIWNHYEVSWLNAKGKPMVALAEITYGCHSPKLIESKSMKLYFNSFNNSKFSSLMVLQQQIANDIANKIEDTVEVKLFPMSAIDQQRSINFEGICVDDLDIDCDVYTVNPTFLITENATVSETLYSNVLKSNCLVTNQPDWGSVQITYSGKKINHEGLLRYIVSFRNHNEFSEHCIERIFVDIMRHCQPEILTVYGRYTRRGGLDINPYRSTQKQINKKNIFQCRQ